jgi:hypothetical protein
MNGLVLFKRYIQSLDTLELSVLIAFSLLITIGEVCMFKFKASLLVVNNVIKCEHYDRVKISFSSRQLTLSPLPI